MAVFISLDRVGTISQTGIFVDANVLLLVFSDELSYAQETRKAKYSKAVKAAVKAAKPLFVDFVVVSEMMNRMLRVAYGKHCSDTNLSRDDFTFKDYRKSESSQESRNAAAGTLRQVLKVCRVTGHQHSKESLGNLADRVSTGEVDSNDYHIAQLCIESGYGLLTDDGDFSVFEDLAVVSGNPRIA